MNNQDNGFFRQFVGEMDSLLRVNEEEVGKSQRQLLNELFKIENKFKKLLISTASGKLVYKEFMQFIMQDKSNMLSARVYFREKQETFSGKMFKAFHQNDPSKLYKFKVNYLFASWAMKRYKGIHKKTLDKLVSEMADIRKILCENNLPLAINRAKLFWNKVPGSHLDYMDLVQTASEGLINAIDKFVPPYKTVFRSVAIGRMTLNMSTDYSSTMVKLPPKERRILYRANKAKTTNADPTKEDITKYVNESFKGVTEADIRDIEAAANQILSIDEKPDGQFSVAEKLPDSANTVMAVMQAEIKNKLSAVLSALTLLEIKIISLKHGDLSSFWE